jgi:primary-amine oxidase
MKLIMQSLFICTALLLLLFADFVTSVPRPAPKSANFRNWRAKNGLNGQTKRTTSWNQSRTTSSCATPVTQAIAAPYFNVWSSLSDDEAASVAKWVFSQPSFNLTSTAEAGEWDNSLYV